MNKNIKQNSLFELSITPTNIPNLKEQQNSDIKKESKGQTADQPQKT